jgi:hypothetical protein
VTVTIFRLPFILSKFTVRSKQTEQLPVLVLPAKLSLSTPSRHMQEVEVKIHPFWTLALDGGKWLPSHPCRLPPLRGKSRRYAPERRLGGRFGEKSLAPTGGSNPGSSSPYLRFKPDYDRLTARALRAARQGAPTALQHSTLLGWPVTCNVRADRASGHATVCWVRLPAVGNKIQAVIEIACLARQTQGHCYL